LHFFGNQYKVESGANLPSMDRVDQRDMTFHGSSYQELTYKLDFSTWFSSKKTESRGPLGPGGHVKGYK